MRRFLLLVVLLSVGSCAAPADVTEIGPNRYAVNAGAMGIEGGEAAARNKALAAAADYCNQTGRQVNVLNLGSKGPVEWGSAAGSASVVFECLGKHQ